MVVVVMSTTMNRAHGLYVRLFVLGGTFLVVVVVDFW